MKTGEPISKLYKQLWSQIAIGRRYQFAMLLILMVLTSFSEVISLGAVLPFLGALTSPDRVFEYSLVQPFIRVLGLTEPTQFLLPLSIAFALAALTAGIMRVTLLYASIRLSFAVGADLSNSAYRNTLYQPYAIHIARNSSEVITGISIKINEIIFYIVIPTLSLISASIILVAIIAALSFFTPPVVLLVFAVFGLAYAVIVRKIRNRLAINSRNISLESSRGIKFIQEGLGGIRDVLIDGTQATFCSIYRNSDQVLRHAQGDNQFISQSPRIGIETLGIVLIAGLAYSLSKESNGLSGAIPILACLALGLQRLLPAMQQAYQAWSTIHGAHSSLQDGLKLLEQPIHNNSTAALDIAIPFKSEIELKNVWFRYESQSNWVLKDVNLRIPKGARIGFIGETGSGKSTLLDLIIALLEPTEGALKIDGKEISSFIAPSWRKHIANVAQTIFLSDASIKENIAFGVASDEIDEERVVQAATHAQISEFINGLPLRYETTIGERGVQLSGGQRQRIGIARALYKKADLIIFDEATSALDSETESAVMRSIDALSADITVLLIAHRLSTLKNCTHIVKLEQGKIFFVNDVDK
jgi:ATP-binding cassette subfamily B protein